MRASWIAFGALTAAVLGAAALGSAWLSPGSGIARGLLIGDHQVPPDGQSVGQWLETRAAALGARTVRFHHEDRLFEATLDSVGIALDVGTTLEQAQRIGRTGSISHRVSELLEARRGALQIPLVYRIDKARAREGLMKLAPAVARAPVDARIDLTSHKRHPDVTGRELDVDATITALEGGTHEDEEIIELRTRGVFAKVSLDDLTRASIEKVVSAQETTFVLFGTGAGRAVNIRNAAARLDGTMVPEGGILSFNEVVGPRTAERGFVPAPEILGDELRPGFGGGTCQVSSTLHMAAVFGALDIVERFAHSRPSSYAQMGLDATVSYPVVDLKIKNTLPYPIMIHAYLPKPTTLRVEILGGDPVAQVDYVYGISKSEDFMRRVTVKSGLEPGTRILHQKGIRGFDVTSIVKVRYPGGQIAERRYFSEYRPAPEIYWIAEGYDVAALPPLPPHAKGVEGSTSDGAG